jgi:hypothetical protein
MHPYNHGYYGQQSHHPYGYGGHYGFGQYPGYTAGYAGHPGFGYGGYHPGHYGHPGYNDFRHAKYPYYAPSLGNPYGYVHPELLLGETKK